MEEGNTHIKVETGKCPREWSPNVAVFVAGERYGHFFVEKKAAATSSGFSYLY
jgi:hypothetical protein